MQSQESQSFPKATSFDATLVRSKIMGPNPLKLCEELLRGARIPRNTIHPVKADASQGLPFEHDFFDAVVSIDSYNYYGRDPHYLGGRLLPYVKQGGMLYRSIPGMVRDCHDNLPDCLLKSWTPEQLDYMHDIAWWRAMIEPTAGVETVSMQPMLCTNEAWEDWLACDNEYAAGDRAAVEAGALEYLNTIAIVLRKL